MAARTRSYARDLMDVLLTEARGGFGDVRINSRLHPEHERMLDTILPPQCREPYRKSIEVLQDWLTDSQRQQFRAKNYFDVVGSHSGLKYRITGPQHGTIAPYNIRALADNNDLCIMPVLAGCMAPVLPAGDILLVQKIALESDELEALAKANWRRPRDMFRFVAHGGLSGSEDDIPMRVQHVEIVEHDDE